MRLSLRKIHPALRLQNLLPLAIYTVLVIMLTMFVSSLLTDHRHPSVISTRLPQFGTPAPARGAPGSSQVKQEREGMPKPEGKHYRPLPKSPAVKRMLESIASDCPAIRSPIVEYLTPDKNGKLSVEQKVLALCDQVKKMTLESFFTPSMQKTTRKLGEGVFGEVYHVFSEERDSLALKIVPIEGSIKVNDESQKTFSEILPEMVISKELSDLSQNPKDAQFYTKNFVHIHKMGLCRSAYPEFLIDAWDQWDDEENSENDRPDIFTNDQQYIVFAYENAGVALERFAFQSSKEARSVLVQIAGALAVAEEAFKFEHRDMHRGNILVKRTKDPTMLFVINGHRYELPSNGILVTVIDYTLSRISQGDCISYTDLNNMPWLFQGKVGNIQSDTYRLMQNCTGSVWSKFAPKNNVHWMHYIVNRMYLRARHKHVTRRQLQTGLRPYLNKFRSYDSAKNVFLSLFSVPDTKLR